MALVGDAERVRQLAQLLAGAAHFHQMAVILDQAQKARRVAFDGMAVVPGQLQLAAIVQESAQQGVGGAAAQLPDGEIRVEQRQRVLGAGEAAGQVLKKFRPGGEWKTLPVHAASP